MSTERKACARERAREREREKKTFPLAALIVTLDASLSLRLFSFFLTMIFPAAARFFSPHLF